MPVASHNANRTSILDARGLDRLRRELQLDAKSFRRLRNDLLKRFQPDSVALEPFPVPDRIQVHTLAMAHRCDSAIDGATKLLLRTDTGLMLESVILRTATGRTTLCVSSQVGCAAACAFCATGQMGIARNLSAAEILDQVLHAGQLLAGEQRKIRNIVFMGMGEPFHNEDQLHAALDGLLAADLFHHAPNRVLVSTVGIPAAMLRCARRFPTVNLALSLHSVDPEVRMNLIPLARRYALNELRTTVQELNRIQKCPVMIEYLMIAGVNDSSAAAVALIDWLEGLRVHVNLIPFNAIDDAPQWRPTDRAGRETFGQLVRTAGFPTTIRYSLGSDIAAACGQLVRRENRKSAGTLAPGNPIDPTIDPI